MNAFELDFSDELFSLTCSKIVHVCPATRAPLASAFASKKSDHDDDNHNENEEGQDEANEQSEVRGRWRGRIS